MSVVGEAVVRIRADAAGLPARVEAEGLRAGKGFASGFTRGSAGTFKGVEKEVNQAARGAAAGSGAFSHLGRSLAFASATFLGTAKAVDLFRQSISSAVDEQKQLERATAIFKGSQTGVVSFANSAAKSLGLSSGAALKFANDLGQMIQPLKLAPRETANVSVELTKLAANLASLRHEDPSVVFTKLTGALRGRAAGLKAYGITISDVTIKEEAMRLHMLKLVPDAAKVQKAQLAVQVATLKLGETQKKFAGQANTYQVAQAQQAVTDATAKYNAALTGTIGPLTAVQKQQAILSILLREGGKHAQDFSAHSKDLANVQAVLHAEIENTKNAIGVALLPSITKVTTAMADWLGKSQNQAKIQSFVTSAAKTLNAVLGTTWSILQTGITLLSPLVKLLGGVGNTVKAIAIAFTTAKIGGLVSGVISSFDAMGRSSVRNAAIVKGATTEEAAVVGASMTSMAAVTEGAALAMKAALISTGIGAAFVAFGLAAEYVITHWDKVKRWFTEFGGWLESHWKEIVLGMVAPIALVVVEIVKHFDTLKGYFWGIVHKISGFFSDLWDQIVVGADHAALDAVEPFSHLPGFLGNWAKKAKTAIQKDLWERTVGDAKKAGGDSATQFQTAFDQSFDAWLKTVGDRMTAAGQAAGALPPTPPGSSRVPGGRHVTDADILPAARRAAGGGAQVGHPGQGTHSYTDAPNNWQSDEAVDIDILPGQDIISPVDGVVKGPIHTPAEEGFSGRFSGGSFYIWGVDGNLYWFKHLRTFSKKIKVGQRVNTGDVLGSGSTTGHLHFAMKPGGLAGVGKVPTPTRAQGSAGSSSAATAAVAASSKPNTLIPPDKVSIGVSASASVAGSTSLPAGWADDILNLLGFARTPSNVAFLQAWQQREGGSSKNKAAFNPLNTKLQAPGSVDVGHGIQAYPDWATGADATAATIRKYPHIMAMLKSGWANKDFPGVGAEFQRWSGGAGAAGSYTWPGGSGTPALTSLTAGVTPKTPKITPPPDIVSVALNNRLQAAKRAVTTAQTRGDDPTVKAIHAEEQVDNAIIRAANTYLLNHPKLKKAVADVKNTALDDITQLKAMLAGIRAKKALSFLNAPIDGGGKKSSLASQDTAAQLRVDRSADKDADVQIAAFKHQSDIDKLILAAARTALARAKNAGAETRKAIQDLIDTETTKIQDIATKIGSLKSQWAKTLAPLNAQLAQDQADTKDVLGTLMSFDPSTVVTTSDKWGRAITETIGQIIAKGRTAWAALQAATRSSSQKVKQAALDAWQGWAAEASAAVGTGLSAAAQAAQAASNAFHTQFQRLSAMILQGFDRQTAQGVSAIQASFQGQIQAVQSAAAAQIASLQAHAQAQIQSLQEHLTAAIKKLQKKLKAEQDALERERKKPTIAEKRLTDFQAGHGAQQDARSLSDAQQGLAFAHLGGDPAEIKAAQRALDDFLFAQTEATLQKSAEASRNAEDESVQRRSEALAKIEQKQEESLQKQEAAAEAQIQKELEARIAGINAATEATVAGLQAQEAAAEQEYQDERAILRQKLEDDLAGWEQDLSTGKKKVGEFQAWLGTQETPQGILGGKLGFAFARGYIAQLNLIPPALASVLAGNPAQVPSAPHLPSNPGCFVAGTLIATPRGEVPIEELRAGDSVLSWDFTSGDVVVAPVEQLYVHEDRETLVVETAAGEVTTTAEHPFYVGMGWRQAGALDGYFLHSFDGENPKVLRLRSGDTATVYNLHVGHDDHNYFAGGFLVHNKVAQFLAGGEVPGSPTGRDDKFILASGGETMIDTRLTKALKRVFLDGQPAREGNGMELLVQLLRDGNVERRKQTALLERPLPTPAQPRKNANQIAFEATR